MAINRIRTLMQAKQLKIEDLATLTCIGYNRWSNVLARKAKLRHEEIQALGEAYPEHRLWLAYGDTMPDAGQIAPQLMDNEAPVPDQPNS